MAEHTELGLLGEELAAKWLVEHGYTIKRRNWRYSYFEIDIIALKTNKIHFIEVKTRQSTFYGYPEDSVTRKKFKRLQQAADQYLHLNPGHKWIQFDVLSIVIEKNKEPVFFLVEDVFY